jgi:hypothetical protein
VTYKIKNIKEEENQFMAKYNWDRGYTHRVVKINTYGKSYYTLERLVKIERMFRKDIYEWQNFGAMFGNNIRVENLEEAIRERDIRNGKIPYKEIIG